MKLEGIDKQYYYFFLLLSSLLNNKSLKQKKLECLDLDSLYRLANWHSLTILICCALEQNELFFNASDSTKKSWKDMKNQLIRKSILMGYERQK